jgi:hypothetical protein
VSGYSASAAEAETVVETRLAASAARPGVRRQVPHEPT